MANAALLAVETGLALIVSTTWDASIHGRGEVIRWWAHLQLEGLVIVGFLPDTPDMQHQIHRETLAGVLSSGYEAAARLIDVAAATIVFRNDAAGALAALRKGSLASCYLPQCSMRLARAMAGPNSPPQFLHAPGRVLIAAEGVDDLSRDEAIQVVGPASDDHARGLTAQPLASCGWPLTIDAFASAKA